MIQPTGITEYDSLVSTCNGVSCCLALWKANVLRETKGSRRLASGNNLFLGIVAPPEGSACHCDRNCVFLSRSYLDNSQTVESGDGTGLESV